MATPHLQDRTLPCATVLAVPPAAANYRASGLVHWHIPAVCGGASLRQQSEGKRTCYGKVVTCITIFTEKHRKGRRGEQVTIPILPPLAESIAATKTGDLTFLVTEFGRPWVKESFGNWFKDVCRAAACPGSAHWVR
jgi:hypothetical protein